MRLRGQQWALMTQSLTACLWLGKGQHRQAVTSFIPAWDLSRHGPLVRTLVHAHMSLHVPCRLPRTPILRGVSGGCPGRPGRRGRQEGEWEGPLGSPAPALPHYPPSAAPRSCIIDKDELKDGLRVLIPMDDKLLYAGHVQTVHSPDM